MTDSAGNTRAWNRGQNSKMPVSAYVKPLKIDKNYLPKYVLLFCVLNIIDNNEKLK